MKNKKIKKVKTNLNADTKVGFMAKRLGVNLGVKPNMSLSNFFRIKGYPSLSDMLEKSS